MVLQVRQLLPLGHNLVFLGLQTALLLLHLCPKLGHLRDARDGGSGESYCVDRGFRDEGGVKSYCVDRGFRDGVGVKSYCVDKGLKCCRFV